MKILQVADVSVSRVAGGAERFLSGQSAALAQHGHQVFVMTRMPEGCAKYQEQLGLIKEFRYDVNQKNPAAFIFSTIRNGGRLFESLCKKYCFDVINFHQPFSAFAVCRSPLCRNIKKIYTCHSLSFEEYVSRNPASPGPSGRLFYFLNIFGRRYIERYVLKRVGRILVLSRYTGEKLEHAHGISRKKTVVIPGGVDLRRFSPARDRAAVRRSLDLPAAGFLLLTVRNLVSRMGIENLLKAVVIVKRKIPEIFLVIGGAGVLRGKLESLARELHITDCVRFEGFIPEKRLSDYYRAADLFVLPTRELEGFGLVTIEAMACGTPVAGTPVGGTAEILSGFDKRFLFADTGAESIADRLGELCRMIMADPGGWEKISQRCRRFVEDRYSWDANVSALERLLAGSYFTKPPFLA
ncbi:MAG: glycosyltransferase family 4 protein [Deltaproteobacteria bacterium]|nr:glycosyltransferase family 4 protein [Deltaproteobacteria bacterium]